MNEVSKAGSTPPLYGEITTQQEPPSIFELIGRVGDALKHIFPNPSMNYVGTTQKPPTTSQLKEYNTQILEFALNCSDGMRKASNFVNVTLSQINTAFGDTLYELASVNWSFGNLSNLTRGAKIFDLTASVSTSLACGAAWLDKASKSVHVSYLKEKLEGESEDTKEYAELKHKINTIEGEIGEGNTSLAFSTLASLSYLVGSVANVVSKAPGWVSPAFGSLAFGVAYASAKIIDLKEDYKQSKQIRDKIEEYKREAGDGTTTEGKIYNMKAQALENYLQKYNKWRKVEHAIDIVVGVTAAVAGVVALTAAGAASFGTIPLAVALAASIGFKVGIVAYQNLKDPESRAKAKLAIQVAFYSVVSSIPGINSKWKTTLQDKEKEYNTAKANELTKGIKAGDNVSNFLSNDNSEKNGVKVLKTEIAKELGLFDDNGKPDPSQVKEDHIHQWLIST